MIIQTVKTRVLHPPKDSLFDVLESSIKQIKEKTIVTITSKVVSIDEGRCLPISSVNSKDDLVIQEASRYLPRSIVKNAWVIHTLTQNMFIPTAGIDESNAQGHYILYPKNPALSARRIHTWLKKKYKVKNLGVIITDSHSIPLRRGTVGLALAYYGFRPVNDYRKDKDLFNRELKITQSNIADGLAAAAVVCQGEGKECLPVTLISEIPFVTFTSRPWKPLRPHSSYEIPPEDDLYFPLLDNLPWKLGEKNKSLIPFAL